MNTNTVELQKFLSGVTYPATKQDIIKSAKDDGAPQEVMSLLHGLPDREYDEPTDVSEEAHKRMK